MTDVPQKKSTSKKGNLTTIIGVGLIAAAVAVLGTLALSYFSNSGNAEETDETSEKGDNLVSLSENFEDISETGLLLIDNGSFNAEEMTTEFSLPSINTFNDSGLPTSSDRESIYKLKSVKTPADIIQGLQNELGVIFEERAEESFKDEGLGYYKTVYRNQTDGTIQQYLRISITEANKETLRWDYTNEIVATVLDWCPDVRKPYHQDFVIPGALPIDQPPPDFSILSEAELREIMDLDAYNAAVEEYDEACGPFESALANRNVFIETSKQFLTVFGLDAETLHFTLRNEAPNVVVEAYQKVGNEIVGKVATLRITADGVGVAYAEGFHYELVELGSLPTLSPADSIFRTETSNKIFGLISPEIQEKTTLVTAVAPEPGQIYSLNRSEKIKVMVNTVDGIYILPGYLLTDSEAKASVYVVALNRDVFRPAGSPAMD
jgi:hypothetical protein